MIVILLPFFVHLVSLQQAFSIHTHTNVVIVWLGDIAPYKRLLPKGSTFWETIKLHQTKEPCSADIFICRYPLKRYPSLFVNEKSVILGDSNWGQKQM